LGHGEGMGVPKPKLVLRIGVTGHLPDKFKAPAQAKVREALTSLFREAAKAAAILRKAEAEFFSDERPEIRIVSALAEGADRVVADAGLDAGFTLHAIFPFPLHVYESDFKTADSKREFHDLLSQARARLILPGAKSADDPAPANRAYETVGLMMLRQCDLVVAVWDGEEARGRGGTETIVQHALASGRPILRFDVEGNGPFLLQPGDIGRFDAQALAARAAAGSAVDGAKMDEIVRHLCEPPNPTREKDKHRFKSTERARIQLCRFLAEKECPWLLGAFSYPLLICLFGFKRGFWRSLWQLPYQKATRAGWSAYLEELNEAGQAVKQPVYDILMPRFAWADNLANRYGQLHRSGYVNNFMLAGAAVLCAVLDRKWLELAAVGIIAIETIRGLVCCWHARWLDYRLLSTLLRHLRAFSLTGSSSPEARTPHISEELSPGAQWVNWYYRMTAREIGVPDVAVDEHYLTLARRAIGRGEIADQMAYHTANATRMRRVGLSLEILGYCLFFATLLICLYEVAADCPYVPKPTEYWNDICHKLTIILPAFGAALFGIRMQGDFEGSADRSDEMGRRLATIAERMNDQKPISLSELSALSEYAAVIMAEEVGDWGFVYRGRPLTLPA
jgi:hypothetical protein